MLVAEFLGNQPQTMVTATHTTPLIDVINVFAEKKVSALVLVDETGQVVGIISEQDVVRSVARFGSGAFTSPISHVGRQNLAQCGCNEPIESLARQMVENDQRHIAVFRRGVFVGLISSEDILSCLARNEQ